MVADGIHWLYERRKAPLRPGVDQVRIWSKKLGIAQDQFPVVHVAGTNGKGSVSALVECGYRLAGYRTGLFTSPHLVSIHERIRLSGNMIPEEVLQEYARYFRRVAVDSDLSFFEIMTLIAFLYFNEHAIEVGIFEVGIGGRLDATNVVMPAAAVITSIGIDHTEVLGKTLGAIAVEKAGIIKPERPVVVGQVPPEAMRVIERRAGEVGAPLFTVRQHFGEQIEAYPRPCLAGSYQRINAATASLVWRVLERELHITQEAIDKALMAVSWPGRWQCIDLPGGRHLILDGSHNPEGATCLEENLRRLTAGGTRPHIVVGILGQERAQALIPVIARYAGHIHLVRPRDERALSPEALAGLLSEARFSGPVTKHADLGGLLADKGVLDSADTVVVTGSLYLVGEALAILQKEGLVGALFGN